ncbi:hypothetical protein BDC45DRAFT_188415 [Circinella umbellata]|nr:hypothetical protein BDC45DRAFT_188415 [Circinella umbellata]
MTYHTQQMAGQKYSSTARTTAPRSLLSSTSPSAAVFTAHSEWEDLLNSKDNRHQHVHPRQQNYHRKNTDACSSDDTNIDKDEMIIDPVPKTSQSNGINNKNSRWPTSPQSAPTSLNSNNNGHSSKANNNTSSNSNSKSNNNSNTKSRSNSNGGGVKKCLYCGSKTTPMWRRGPQGAGTLCNACGVKWKHGKILQNASGTENSSSSTQSSATTTTPKERRGSLSTAHKNEKKRKKSTSNGSSSTSSGSGSGGRSSLDHHHYRRSSNRSASTTPAVETSSFAKSSRQNNYSDDNDDVMENNINAARNLSIREDEDEYQHHRFLSSSVPSNRVVDTFAVPWLPRDNNNNSTRDHQQQQRQVIMTVATDNVSSSSHSISGSYSPIDEPSPNSSPRLSSTASSVVNMQQRYYYHTRRHTMDIPDKFEYNTDTSAFAISAGVDAVEAAAVLTLLKRS